MKKFLSFFAFVAMLCIPFCLVSCGDDDDPATPPTPSAKVGTYSITITTTVGGGETIGKVVELIKEKVGADATIQKESETKYKMQVKDKAKADAVIKGLVQYKADLDRLMKENTKLMYLSFNISDDVATLFKYDYENEDIDTYELMSYGVYSYTDAEGLVWTFTYTDQDAGNGTKVGSLVVPKDVDNAKAGTYEGKCVVRSSNIEFNSNLMQGTEPDLPAVYARFGYVSEAGVPTLVKIYSTRVFYSEFFQKVK